VLTALVVFLSVFLVLMIALIVLLLPSEEVIAEEPAPAEKLPRIINVPMGVTTRVGDFLINVYSFEYRPFLGHGYGGTFVGVKPPDYFLILYAEVTNTGKTQKPLDIQIFSVDEKQWYSEEGDLELNSDLFFANRLQTGFKYNVRLPYEVTYGEKHEVRLYLDKQRYKRIQLIK